MDEKCNGCNEIFDKSKLGVTKDGIFWCDGCRPALAKPVIISLRMYVGEANALSDYIDGDRDLDTLEVLDLIKERLDKTILITIRKALNRGGEVPKPNPESMGSGDAER
jgi:hypothetical protein